MNFLEAVSSFYVLLYCYVMTRFKINCTATATRRTGDLHDSDQMYTLENCNDRFLKLSAWVVIILLALRYLLALP